MGIVAMPSYEQLLHDYSGWVALVFGILLFALMLAKIIRARFEHRYWSLRARAQGHRADSKSRDDTVSIRALEALIGVGVRLQQEMLRARALRVLLAVAFIAFVATAGVLATQAIHL